ncbi:SDR family NAD(P)-dependent oxidoreductase [Paracoccus liaowanqingii]|uniref:SDR family NAD(P)-dependent oxidoreductase n=1 Tax=Paracoccus liaowanqingii TaxID=2560053 RepID=A0A4P7HNS4_9RHOB|nr:SDR family NAD(P)-dependent oxidoreductase [Paracoccus liaowanqingii]QBX35936.1 SDR family NAD(P)-dependent oxidoreductase [Paracoccus liaowanqingii]
MTDNRVALVTGANQGIGFQIARDLAAQGLTVLVGARDLAKGEAAANQIGDRAHAIRINVTDQASIDAAAERIRREFGRLDVLMNNAGISRAQPDQPFGVAVRTSLLTEAPIADVRRVFETNVFGVIAVTQAMLPLLREAPAGRIVITGSSGASLSLNSDPTNDHRRMFGTYSVSKTAVHAVMLAFALALEDTRIKVNAACPGFTSTALNNFNGTRSLQEGAREPVRLALIGDAGPTGSFSDEDGPVAW